MNALWLTIKGMLMGISNIIPGVSGGTMAVSLGIYDDLIFSITQFLRKKRKSIKFLVPLGVGLALGIIFFSYAIEFLLAEYAFITSLAFVGLILGGLPVLLKEFKQALIENNEKISIRHGLVFIVFMIVVIGFSLMQEPVENASALEISFGNILILFGIGIIASATMIIPGISGSLVLMIFGYYYQLLQLLTSFFNNTLALNWEGIFENLVLIAPVGLGILLGIFLVSKMIEYLFIHYPSLTYSGILGLVIASPFAIIYNTNALADLAQANTSISIILGSVLLVIGFYLILKLGQVDEETE